MIRLQGAAGLGLLAAALGGLAVREASAQAVDTDPVTVGGCAGPRVQTVIQGDYRRGIPDRVVGNTPPVYGQPGGDRVGQLVAGTAYTVVSERGGYFLLRADRFSRPFQPGQTVGWVRTSDVHSLMLRNCV